MSYSAAYGTTANTKKDMPSSRHWAIIKYTVDISDLDSHGRGYPDHTEAVVKYEAYNDKTTWENAIRELEASRHGNYAAMQVNPATITSEVTVEVIVD